MKTSLMLVVAGLVLATQAFGQEPTQALAKQVATPQTIKAIIVTGSAQPDAPVIEPKALPVMNPTLGDIARQARADHANAPKAHSLVETDTVQESKKDDPPAEAEGEAKDPASHHE